MRAGVSPAFFSRVLLLNIRLWLVLAGLCSALHFTDAAARPMRFERFGLDQGLSQQNVTAIAQDSRGFLWLGTEDGLNRYDGYSFEHVRHDRTRNDSLPSSWVSSIAFDRDGRLWVATEGGGIVWRDPMTGRFTRIAADDGGSSISGLNAARALHFDRRGQLWIGTREHGVIAYDPRARTFKHIGSGTSSRDSSLGASTVFAFLETGSDDLWIGTGAGLERLSLATGAITPHPLVVERLASAESASVRALVEDRDGTVWVATSVGLESFSLRTGITHTYRHDAADPRSLPSSETDTLLVDNQGRLWVGTTQGLALFDAEKGDFTAYRSDPADATTLPDDHIVSLFQDHGGLLWVGTKTGIAKWSPRTWSFGHHQAGPDEGLASRYINGFTEDHAGKRWIATFGGGITVVDPISNATTTLRRDARLDGLPDDQVMALLTDHAGMVWAGTMGGGLSRFDPLTLKANSFRHDLRDPTSLPASGVMSLFEDSKGRLWVGTYGGGLARYERETASFTQFPAVGDRVTAIAEDGRGRIWAGTDGNGVAVLNPESGELAHLRRTGSPTGLSGNTVYAIHFDSRGAVWIGTSDGGLDHASVEVADLAAIRFSNLSEADGLPNNTIYGIEEDFDAHLWVSTNHGLGRIDARTGEVRSFHRAQGLQAEEFNFGAHYRSREGQLLFGGANGYNAFEPGRLQFNDTPPSIALTGLLKLNKPAQTPALYESLQSAHLGYRDDVITFEFAALDFEAPAANQFKYQLVGFDPNWVNAGTRRSVTYTRLAGGNYTLRVRAANADGAWNQQDWKFRMEVDPPPWKSWWAYCIYGVVVLMVLWATWAAHRRTLQRETQYGRQLECEVRDRTRELAQRNTQLEDSYTKLEEVNSRLEEVSQTDALTGLGNRRSLHQAIPRLVAQVDAANHDNPGSQNRLALMLIDLDRLKPINDEHGHEAGDQVLSQVSSVLSDSVRDTDKVVRWGGDEFVIAYFTSGLKEASILAERIRSNIARKRFRISGQQIAQTSVSIGIACYPFVAEAPELVPWEEVLNLADAALYRAKRMRNSWVGWAGMRSAATLTDLLDRLENDAEAAEREGYIESCTSAPVSDETVEMLLRQTRASAR